MLKNLIILIAVALGASSVRAAAPLTQWESDSISAALAGVWGDYFAKRGALSDAESRAQYIQGLKAALSAADSSAAYADGVESGVLVNARLKEIEKMGMMKIDREAFVKDIEDIINGKPAQYTPASGDKFMQEMMLKRTYRGNEVIQSEAMMDSVAAIEGIVKTPEGIYIQILTEGEGNPPKPDADVNIMYVTKLPNGRVIDGTRDMPETMSLTRVIPGFRQGFMYLKPGGKYKMWVPSNLAYGSVGVPGTIPGNCALEFDVDFRGIKSLQ